MATVLYQQPIVANENERQSLERLDTMLQPGALPQGLRLVGEQGEEMPLSESVVTVLRQLVHYLAHDKAVVVVPVNKALTTQEAADILNISRPYLIKLLEKGVLSYIKVGTHRRVQFGDIMAYKQLRDAERTHALDELTALNQEMGLYEH